MSSPDGTNSEVFQLAIPALARAVEMNGELKATFYQLLRYWLAFREERSDPMRPKPPGEATDRLIRAARAVALSPAEFSAIDTISVRGPANFAPADWMLGAM